MVEAVDDSSSGFSNAAIVTSTVLLTVLLTTFVVLAGIQFFFLGPHEVPKTEFQPVSYVDFISILLAIITVLLGIFGILFAVLAVVGYSTMRKATLKQARSSAKTQAMFTAEQLVEQSMGEGGKIYSAISQKLDNDPVFRREVLAQVAKSFHEGIGRTPELDDDEEFSVDGDEG